MSFQTPPPSSKKKKNTSVTLKEAYLTVVVMASRIKVAAFEAMELKVSNSGGSEV